MINPVNIKKQGLAVDIDETLSWTVGHWVEQMQNKFGNPENLSVKELIEKYRYTINVPYWQSDEAMKWIDSQISSNEVQENLPLIEESNIYLDKINQIIPVSAYITVRPQSIIKGTKRWLDKHNFPDAPIICRPTDIIFENGNKWKAEILNELYPKIKGIIDDNAKLLKYLGKDYKGVVFLYDHTQVDTNTKAIACKHWLNVYEEVRKYFIK